MKLRHLLLACSMTMPLLEADTLRIVELEQLGVRTGDAEPRMSVSPWNKEGFVLFPGIRGAAILEAYVARPESAGTGYFSQAKLKAAIRLRDDRAIEGFVDTLPSLSEGHPDARLQPLSFKLDPSKLPAATEEEFAAIRKAHEARMAQSGLPGAAWYRHRAGGVGQENRWSSDESMDSTFRMASGGRAVAENLALDRDLILASGGQGEAVDIATLKGITVPAIDWTGKLKAGEVKVDPTAMFIPEDQHALILPSLATLLELRDVLNKEGTPILQSYDVRSPYQGLVARYQAQMGIANLDSIARTLDLGTVAVTGSDPFFATGTDLALVFATDKPEMVFEALGLTLGLKAKLAGVEMKEENGIRGYQSEDRSFSAYLAKFEGAVVISNSLAQVKRIGAVARKETPALGSLDEYKFFRQRYPADAEEDAYLFLSDATIRRWCSPAVRIAASRRTRAAAALGELVAAKLDGQLPFGSYASLLGKTAPSGETIRSEIYNTLGFVTPAAELEIKTATAAEVEAYTRWREGYESGWRRVFDPIAIRLRMDGAKRQLDLTVMPLTVDSDYREWMGITGSKKPERGAHLAHEGAKAFFSFAIDHESETFRKMGEQSLELLPTLKANALGWMGDSVSVYLDDAFFWRALRTGDAKTLLEMNYLRLPLGVRIDSRSGVQLALFLTALRHTIEESAPNLLDWQQRKHGEVSYVAVLSKEERETPMSAAVYYATLKNALILSLDEKVLLNAIDREGKKAATSGEHVQVEADSEVMTLLGMAGSRRLDRQRIESWAALPILNEWRRRNPGKDPLTGYAAAFKEEIRCPGGKSYRWNDSAGTMESVAFGHPAEPRGEEVKFAAGPLRFRAGISFEDDGLRLRASLEPEPAAAPATTPDAAQAAIEIPANFPQLKDLIPTTEGLELTYQVDETDAEGPYKKTVKMLAPTPHEEGTLVRSEVRIDAEGEEEDSSYSEEMLLSKDDKGYGLMRVKREDGDRVFGRAMPLLPARLAPGISFGGDYDSEVKSEDEVIKDAGTRRARIVRLEKVEVPAGVFENCVRIDGEYDYLGGDQIGRVTESMWYAPGVGIVKSTWKTEFGHGAEILQSVVKP